MSVISGAGMVQCDLCTSWTNDSLGRRFYGCQDCKRGGCEYFAKDDPSMCSRTMTIIPGLRCKIIELEDEIQKMAMKNKEQKIPSSCVMLQPSFEREYE
ncbi:hypothetical protein Pfo_026711 [Paulownia fortunei]|nr:hypothetical protein Pfo_026711 [Paulownia fortunei]